MRFFQDLLSNGVHLSEKRVPIRSAWSQSIRKAARSLGENTLMTRLSRPYQTFPQGTLVLLCPGNDLILIEDYWHTHRQGEMKREEALGFNNLMRLLN